MSRTPTQFGQFQQQQIQVQPQAAPTDQFVQPAVHNDSGSDLFSLADSLKSLNPQLQQVIERRYQADQTNQKMQAQQDYVAARSQNVKDYQAAVKAGMIQESAGPWYQVAAKQLFQQDKMSQADAEAFNQYQTDPSLVDSKGVPLKFSDDTAAVQQFFNGKMADAMKGADAWESEVAVPMAQHIVARRTQEHEYARVQDRPLEMQEAFNSRVGTIMAPVTPEKIALAAKVTDQTTLDAQNPDQEIAAPARAALQAQRDILQAQSDLQHTLDNQGHVTNPATVKQWMHQALTQTAMDRRDSTMFTQFYGGLTKGDGSPLDNSDASSAHGVQLTRLIKEQKLSDMRTDWEQQTIEDQKNKREGAIALANKVHDLQVKNPKFNFLTDFTSQMIREHIDSLPPAVRAATLNDVAASFINLNSITNIGRDQTATALLMKRAGEIAAGALDGSPEEQKAFIMSMISGTGDASKARQWLQVSDEAGRQFPVQSSKAALNEFNQKMASDEPVTPEWISQYQQKWDGQLARGDWEAPVHYMVSQAHGDFQPLHSLYARMANQLSSQMEARFIKTEEQKIAGNPAAPFTGNRVDLRDKALQAVAGNHNYLFAKQEAMNRFSRWWQDSTTPAKRAGIMQNLGTFEDDQVRRNVDSISADNGGFTRGEYDTFRKEDLGAFNQQAPPANAPSIPFAPTVPGTPQHTMIEATQRRLLPDSASLPIDMQQQVNDVLTRVPPGITERQKQEAALPVEPYKRWSWMNNPDPTDHAAVLSWDRQKLRDGGVYWTTAGEKIFSRDVQDARAEARTIEGKLQNVKESYGPLLDNAQANESGQKVLGASSWLSMSKVEQLRVKAAQLRQGAGYDPAEVGAMMQAGDKDAWKTKAMFTSLEDYNPDNPTSLKKIHATMKQIGLDPSNRQTVDQFLNFQRDATIRLRTQQ